jgi:nitrile hydratase subunit alpha
MSDEHGHGHHHPTPPSSIERRAAALEELLTEKGLVPDNFIEEVNRVYENDIGPMNGARAVAHAWVDADYKARLLENGSAALAELGIGSPDDHIVVVANTPGVHNVVVCTLCSCYPWSILGLPPGWYKEAPYRARMVREPRALLKEMGCDLPGDVDLRVWDSSAEVRYLVVPERPAGTESVGEEELVRLVTRDSMIGVARL